MAAVDFYQLDTEIGNENAVTLTENYVDATQKTIFTCERNSFSAQSTTENSISFFINGNLAFVVNDITTTNIEMYGDIRTTTDEVLLIIASMFYKPIV
jgi:hypothetical protein